MKKIFISFLIISLLIGCSNDLKSQKPITPLENDLNNPNNSNPAQTSTPSTENLGYNLSEVQKHDVENDCWTIINNKVYDITRYVPIHPGGKPAILKACGKDGTNLFESEPHHQEQKPQKDLESLYIGELN